VRRGYPPKNDFLFEEFILISYKSGPCHNMGWRVAGIRGNAFDRLNFWFFATRQGTREIN